MILNIIFAGLVIIKEVSAHPKGYLGDLGSYKTQILDSRELRNRDELARFIDHLNERNDKRGDGHKIKPYAPTRSTLPHYVGHPDESYDTERQRFPNVRIHHIQNPEVLEAFVQSLRNQPSDRSTSDSSSSDSDSDIDRRFGGGDVRRNADFRGSNEDEVKNEVIDLDFGNIPQSLEKEITPFKSRSDDKDETKPPDDFKLDSGNIEDFTEITKRFKIKSQVSKKKKSDTWDSKPGFDWKDDNKKSKEDVKDIKWDDNDGDKETSKFLWDLPIVKIPKDAYVKEKISDDWNMNGQLDDSSKPRARKQKGFKNSEESSWKKDKKKKDNFEDSWDVKTTKGIDDWDKKESFGEDTWSKKKKKAPKVDSWDEPTTKKKKVVRHDTGKEADNNWDKVGVDWDKPNKEKSWDSKPKSSWKSPKRNKEDAVYDKPSYVARIPEYHRDRGGGGSFQGRTPIPFVGRHGIYEDKK